MMRYTKEDINNIIGLKGADGKLINIFDLHGLLYVGNTTPEGMWDLLKTYALFSEHSLTFIPEDFENCNTPEEVRERFSERLRETVSEKLV